MAGGRYLYRRRSCRSGRSSVLGGLENPGYNWYIFSLTALWGLLDSLHFEVEHFSFGEYLRFQQDNILGQLFISFCCYHLVDN